MTMDSRMRADRVNGALRAQIHRLYARDRRQTTRGDCSNRSTGGIDTGPSSAYEAVTRQMVTDLADDLSEIKSRLNALVFALIGGILLEIFSRMTNV
jgi:hypothetical protein